MTPGRPALLTLFALYAGLSASAAAQSPAALVREPAVQAAGVQPTSGWVPKDLPNPGQLLAQTVPLVVPEAEPALTLQDLEAIAAANNPTLIQAEMRVRGAAGRQLQAGLYPNPVAGYRAEEIGEGGRAGQEGAFFRQELVRGGKLDLASAVAGHEVRQAQFAAEAQRQRVLNNVRTGYYELLAAQRAVELNRQLLHVGEEGVRAAGELFRAKEVSRVDELQARIESDSARLRLHEAENRHQAAWRQMGALLGTPQMPLRPLAGNLEETLPNLAWNDALTNLLTASPELAEAQAGVDRARCALAREQAEQVSNLDVEADVRHNTDSGYTTSSVLVGMPLQLFNRNQGNICRAQAGLASAQHEVRRVELALQDRLAAAFERYSTASQDVQQYQETILPNARTSLELVQTGYRQGEFGYLILLTAQRTYFQASLTYLESLRQMRIAVVEIEGLLLTGGLRPVTAAGGE